MVGMNETDTPRLLDNVSLLHVPPVVTSSCVFSARQCTTGVQEFFNEEKKLEMNADGETSARVSRYSSAMTAFLSSTVPKDIPKREKEMTFGEEP